MGIKYQCIRTSEANKLTQGKEYTELNTNPCAFNACIRNDEDRTIFLARKDYFVNVGESE